MQHNTFTQRVLGAIFMGFVAACLIYFLRHFVNEAFNESGSDWKKMYEKASKKH